MCICMRFIYNDLPLKIPFYVKFYISGVQDKDGIGHIRLYKDIATTSCADNLASNVALK